MDRAKFEKAVKIREKITNLQELASDLQSVNCIIFFIHNPSTDRRLSVLWKDGDIVHNRTDGKGSLLWQDGDVQDLFDIIIGNVMEKIEDRLKDLEDEFDKL